jgi:hypothetical protein
MTAAQKSIYDRMTASALLDVVHTESGTSPQRTFIAEFYYANGLRTSYDGARWSVTNPEYVSYVPEYAF